MFPRVTRPRTPLLYVTSSSSSPIRPLYFISVDGIFEVEYEFSRRNNFRLEREPLGRLAIHLTSISSSSRGGRERLRGGVGSLKRASNVIELLFVVCLAMEESGAILFSLIASFGDENISLHLILYGGIK